MQTNAIMRPWAGAREQGRGGIATLLFFMQISLVLWPSAVRIAARMERERQRLELLNELARRNAPPKPREALPAELTPAA